MFKDKSLMVIYPETGPLGHFIMKYGFIPSMLNKITDTTVDTLLLDTPPPQEPVVDTREVSLDIDKAKDQYPYKSTIAIAHGHGAGLANIHHAEYDAIIQISTQHQCRFDITRAKGLNFRLYNQDQTLYGNDTVGDWNLVLPRRYPSHMLAPVIYYTQANILAFLSYEHGLL